MRLLRLLVAALCLATLGSVTAPAYALGTLTVSTGLPMWSDRSQTDRKLDLINRQDCLDNAKISFSATFMNNPGGAFEVWSGTACDMLAGRTPATATCVKVYAGTSGLNQTVTVRAQALVRATTDDPTNAEAGTAAACDATNSTSQSSRALFFVVYDAGSNMSLITSTPKWNFRYDTVGPSPPTGVTADSGESALLPRFTAPAAESNIIRYHFFCSLAVQESADTAGTGGTAATAGTSGTDTGGTGGTDMLAMAGVDTGGTGGTGGTAGTDTGGTAGTDTGGTAGTAGTDTAGTTSTAGTSSTDTSAGGEASTIDPLCHSAELVPGQDPPAGFAECGSVSAKGVSDGETNDSLENGVRYAVAIAAEDDANNLGKLSNLACGVPQEVTGFFEAYRAAGGQAGGGYCTFAPATRGAAAMGVFLLLGVGALFARRRK